MVVENWELRSEICDLLWGPVSKLRNWRSTQENLETAAGGEPSIGQKPEINQIALDQWGTTGSDLL